MEEQITEQVHKFLQLLMTDVDRAKARAVDRLKTLANELDEKQRDMNIAKTSFASTGIVGSGLAIAGVIAAPFTAGASLALTVAGVGVGAASGLGGLATSIANHIINSKTTKEAEASIADYQKKANELVDTASILYSSAHGKKKLEEMIHYEKTRIYETDKRRKLETILRGLKTGFDTGGTTALIGATVGGAALRAGATAGKSAAQVLATGVKVARIGGIVLSVITVPIDLATMISNAVKIHRKTPSELAEQIRQMANGLEAHEILG